MKLEQAKTAIYDGTCNGCRFLKEDNTGFECLSEDPHDCEDHKILAARIIISSMEELLSDKQGENDE